jgi:L-aminopeptidase/D-esterase-like protein
VTTKNATRSAEATDVITDVNGVRVGHWTDRVSRTGCTVVLLPEDCVASGEVRGGSPATREFALLDPLRKVETVHAIVLSGGSAFGLASCDGVVNWLEEHGIGFPTAVGPVPIVVGLSLFDLAVGDGKVRPGPSAGRSAAEAAVSGSFEVGQVGAATGATVGKWAGRAKAAPGGFGTATLRSGDLVVSALIAVNAFGYIDDGNTVVDIGAPNLIVEPDNAFGNTTIGVIATNATLSKKDCHLVAQSGHDGVARALLPAHTDADGDALVAVATGAVEADFFHLRLLAQQAVTRAIRSVGPAAKY